MRYQDVGGGSVKIQCCVLVEMNRNAPYPSTVNALSNRISCELLPMSK